ncbi:hypothetical protein CRG98_036830 [Punica granatum]|uniref:Aminotransferase-like plant mobile domain-containing protein n=1 Tax=Punica granatum TaxID=22663 RepID=A0A2I0IFL1_PUNGR|nr:hypothetical protein CRG98_036830 [Punica granatum]
MSHSFSCPRLDRVTPPLEEIARIWTTLRPVDCHYIAAFVGDIPLLATRRVDWNFLEAAIIFWNPSRAVFDIQGTELTSTIEKYRTLIGRTTVIHSIVEPNFHTAQSTLVSRLTCSDFNGVPLVSHAGSTTYFSARVVKQLGGLQTVSEDTTRTKFEHIWREDQTSVDRQNSIQQVLAAWRTVVPERLYFPEHPTHDERDFQATEEYVLRFYRWEKDEQLVHQPQLQKELAQTRTELQRRDQELARATATLERFRKRARGGPHAP